MNIKERLKLIDALPRSHGISAKSAQPNVPKHENDIHTILAGETIETQFGSFFRARRHYPAQSVHGSVPISSVLNKDASLLTVLENNPALANLDLRQVLFVDTETTGLSGGVGTCAFLIGIGYFGTSGFVVDQYLMNDFHEEMAMLQSLSDFVGNYSAIVTYNGKSFDIPLLNSRHIYVGLTSPFDGMLHIDLLHCVRRLWNHRLPDCVLTTAEMQLLAAARQGDVPGFLIPTTYFEFLRSRDPEPLRSVLYHNEKDIVAMVTLLNKACELVADPLSHCVQANDIVRVGKLYEKSGLIDTAIQFYEAYRAEHSPNAGMSELLIQLAFAYKKSDRQRQAAAVWENCIAAQRYHPLPYIELAKYYEHRAKRFDKALSLVDKALSELDVIGQVGGRQDWAEYEADLAYRRNRLLRKVAR